MKRFLLILSLLVPYALAQGENLLDVYHQAVISDPTYQNAIATFKDNRELLPQSIAALLANIAMTANTTYTRFDPRIPSTNFPLSSKYNSNGYQLTVDQPLFNFSNWAKVSSSRAVVKSAYATLLAARQDLMLRVAKAYFAVLNSQDTLRFLKANREFLSQQLDQSKQSFKVGLVAITNVYDAQAAYDAIVAKEIQASNAVTDANEQLREITGKIYAHLAPLKQMPLVTPVPNNIDTWSMTAEQNNLSLLASHFEALAARDKIWAAGAQNLPTLDAVGNYGKTKTGNAGQSFQGGGGTTQTAALQLSVPIFSGGAVFSQTRQAQDQYIEAITTLEKLHRNVISTVRQAFNGVISGISQLSADHQSIVSHQASLNATLAGYHVGTSTMVDVLQSQSALLQAQQTFASDQYNYINTLLTLKSNAGTLNSADLAEISSWLEGGHLNNKSVRTLQVVPAAGALANKPLTNEDKTVASQPAEKKKAKG